MTILTIEQYESLHSLSKTLKNLGFVNLNRVVSFLNDEKEYWEICGYCAEVIAECNCGNNDLGRYYAEYDDDASFE